MIGFNARSLVPTSSAALVVTPPASFSSTSSSTSGRTSGGTTAAVNSIFPSSLSFASLSSISATTPTTMSSTSMIHSAQHSSLSLSVQQQQQQQQQQQIKQYPTNIVVEATAATGKNNNNVNVVTSSSSSSKNKRRNMMNNKYTRRRFQKSSTTPSKLLVASSSSSSSSPSKSHSSSFSSLSRGGALFPTSAVIGNIGKRTISILKSTSFWKKIGITSLILMLLSTVAFTSLYIYHEGFRRTVIFWKGMGPILIKYKILKFRSRFMNEDIYEDKLHKFNVKAANDITTLIQTMGGIYIKIGQVMSTVGQGLLPDEYTSALQPLQNGVLPKSFKEIKQIIETSTGKPLKESFIYFDPKPIGSASIAQAHRAILRHSPKNNNENTSSKTTTTQSKRRNGYSSIMNNNQEDEEEEVVVKVQYPEVARLFEADLANMELVTKWISPENIPLVESLRKRHERELDFTIEATNLIECSNNLKRYNIKDVRIPSVRNETGLCTKHVLVMEYFKGQSLSDIITKEQDIMAKALGKANATELRSSLAKQMREHFERGGGGPGDESIQGFLGGGGGGGGVSSSSTSTTTTREEQTMSITTQESNNNKNNKSLLSNNKRRSSPPPSFVMNLMSSPLGGTLFRSYVKIQSSIQHVTTTFENLLKGKNGHNMNNKKSLTKSNINLSKILKTLIKVHGYQMLIDGVYNADPHPGNVLILDDGKTLGLLDYGMVGRLSNKDRLIISQTVLSLAQGNKVETANQYRSNGYSVTSSIYNKNITNSNEILHRFATFHLDKIDLSPIYLEQSTTQQIAADDDDDNNNNNNDDSIITEIDTLELLRSLQETRVPVWVEEARRLGGLLMGVSAQAARPISLAKQWESIAKQALTTTTTTTTDKHT